MKRSRQCPAMSACLAVLATAIFAGCGRGGPAEAKVSGSIKFDGKPLETGTITFIPSDGKGATAGTEIKEGRYSLRVPPGPKRVEVRSPKSKPAPPAKPQAGPQSPPPPEESIPAVYNSQSTISKEVKMPETKIDLDLTSEAAGAKR